MYSICGHFEVLSPDITKKIWSANRKSSNLLTSTFVEGPQLAICGIICGLLPLKM
jgi:hypothetical protein